MPAAADPTSPAVDWSRLRGSPAAAMEETLAWLDATHGGAAAYLASAGVPAACLARLRARATGS